MAKKKKKKKEKEKNKTFKRETKRPKQKTTFVFFTTHIAEWSNIRYTPVRFESFRF